MKCILVDDEAGARDMLRHLLQNCIPGVEIAGEAASVPEAVKLIHRTSPDIVFLDIEMPLYSGLELLDFLDRDSVQFRIVFVTAYAEHAIKAFRLAAIDYLLKPVQLEQLREAVRKASAGSLKEEQIRALQQNYREPARQQMALSLAEGLTIIELADILYLKAEGSYTQICLCDGQKIVASRVLGEFAFLTEQQPFFRTHRSYIVNKNRIRRISRSGNEVVLQGEIEIPVTPDRKSELLEAFRDIRI
ncbi:MAG: LytR/AlgR family response regulator transcription factor [Flavobacteriales bacterium]